MLEISRSKKFDQLSNYAMDDSWVMTPFDEMRTFKGLLFDIDIFFL